jgi:DHA2 family multidrug resistance protein-like MFS transporter
VSFTWGTILVAVGTLALIGVLFAMPQYFQAVVGTDAMGSGLRLLPLIAGFVVGLLPAQQLARLLGAKLTVALGFAVVVAGLLLGARTGVAASDAFVAAWMSVVGMGMGLAFTTAASTALSELQPERSGVGSAMLQALKNVGAPFGAAILGSVLSNAYQARLRLAGLPQASARLARESVFGGLAVARERRSQQLIASVRSAFVHGLDEALVVSAAFALAGLVLALVFLPKARAPRMPVQEATDEERELVGIS